MNNLYRTGAKALLAMFLALGLVACGDKQEVQLSLEPVAFHESDECHVCGMIISDFPGPKGEAVEKGSVKKFCSTAEMLGWYLQPENKLLDAKLYVHDMGQSEWAHPSDEHLIDARTAWYVAGTGLKGAMGGSLASLADEQKARQLASDHGGQVLRFEEIDHALLQQGANMQHHDMQAPMSPTEHNDHAGH